MRLLSRGASILLLVGGGFLVINLAKIVVGIATMRAMASNKVNGCPPEIFWYSQEKMGMSISAFPRSLSFVMRILISFLEPLGDSSHRR